MVTSDMSRYIVFVNFNPSPGEENNYFTHIDGVAAKGYNEWRPSEFKCLEYVDWNTSNKVLFVCCNARIVYLHRQRGDDKLIEGALIKY